jgi:hypothetical protein
MNACLLLYPKWERLYFRSTPTSATRKMTLPRLLSFVRGKCREIFRQRGQMFLKYLPHASNRVRNFILSVHDFILVVRNFILRVHNFILHEQNVETK